MRKTLIGVGTAALIFGGVVAANAVILQLDDERGFDKETGLYWRLNINEFTNQTYADQINSIDNLNPHPSPSIGDWRMADLSEMEDLLSNYTIDYLSQIFSESADNFWEARFNYSDEPNTHYFLALYDNDSDGHADVANNTTNTLNAFSSITPKDDFDNFQGLGAWTVADLVETSSPDPVPEPTTMLLFGTGLVGLAGVSRRKKK